MPQKDKKDIIRWYNDMNPFDELIPPAYTEYNDLSLDIWLGYMDILYRALEFEYNEKDSIELYDEFLLNVQEFCTFQCNISIEIEITKSRSKESYIIGEKIKDEIQKLEAQTFQSYDALFNAYYPYIEQIENVHREIKAEQRMEEIETESEKRKRNIDRKEALIIAVVTVLLSIIGSIFVGR